MRGENQNGFSNHYIYDTMLTINCHLFKQVFLPFLSQFFTEFHPKLNYLSEVQKLLKNSLFRELVNCFVVSAEEKCEYQISVELVYSSFTNILS